MDLFPAWIIPKLEALGYSQTSIEPHQKFVEIGFNEQTVNDFTVIYVHQTIDAQFIRNVFDTRTEPVLFVVDIELITMVTDDKPLWIKALHAIYYGRVYCWNGQGIRPMHFDWAKKELHTGEYVDIDGILFTDTDCKLKDFPGIFHIARFYDKAFWTEKVNSKQSAKDRKWDDFEKRQQRKTDEDIYEAFKRAYREHMRNHNAYHDDEPVQPRYAPKGNKWIDLFIGTGSIEAARAKYRELAKQYHPDLNPGSSEALSTMQAINIAFDKVKEYWK